MKKLFLLAALVMCLAVPSSAATLTLSTNAEPVMVVPPVIDPALWAGFLPRSAGSVVFAGDKYRVANRIIVAAHSGTVTNTTTVTTVISTNLSVGVMTNSYTNVTFATVPVHGISGYDGTARWYRPAVVRNHLRLAVSIGSDGGACSVVLSDGEGNDWTYTASAVDDGFVEYQGALYARKTSTNTCSITTMSW